MSRKGRWTLQTFFPVTQYMAAVLIALSYPRLSETTWLLPGVTGSRAWLMLWVPALLGVAVLMDRAHLRAYQRDLWELEHKTPHGNMNRSTLLAIGVPCLFVLDAVAVAHLYLSYFRGGPGTADASAQAQQTAALAVGIVLWIYGRFLPKLPFESVWGIRTRRTLADTRAWGSAHLKATPWFCACGAAALAAGVFLPPLPGLCAAVVCCAVALAGALNVRPDGKNA